MDRFYLLPLDTQCLPGCRVCYRIGCRNNSNRSIADILRLLNRAQEGEFTGVVFSSSFFLHHDADRIYAECLARGLKPYVQIHWPALQEHFENVLAWCKRGLHLNIIFQGNEFVDPSELKAITFICQEWHITLAPLSENAAISFLRSLEPEYRERLYFQFTPYSYEQGTLSVKEVRALISKIESEFPTLKIRPPRGHEVWDPRISPDLALDSDAMPIFSYSITGEVPKISVVIPSYNSGSFLKNVVRHLLWQNLARSQFEIIIVDDGSTDESLNLIQNFLAPEAGNLNFKYIYFHRSKNRERGDGNFRAGIARNLGVKHARGKIFAFLDSDMIVPPNYLEDLLEKHERYDVIQSVRFHLKEQAGNEFLSYAKINQRKDCFVLEKNYWGPFFKKKNWESIPNFWKYTCTYSLSVLASRFKAVGWFRKTYVYYGFEDVDLGYRLAKHCCSFYLNPLVTYHLNTKEDRSEYRKSNFQRHALLAKTAKIFFLNTLDTSIYAHFLSFMGQEKSFFDHFRKRSAASIATDSLRSTISR